MAGDVYSGNVRTLGMVSSSDLNNRFSSSRNKWERVSNGRYWMAHDALTRGGASSLDADRLARILAAQSALEAGWEDSVSSNNYAGYMSNGKKMRFSSPEAFWDYHIKNLDEKWPGWRNAQTIDEYYRTVNHPELGLDTQKKFDDYNKAHHDSPVYIYAPEWDNSDYRQNLFNVYNNYINKYVPALEYSNGGKMGRIQLLAKKLQNSGNAGIVLGNRFDEGGTTGEPTLMQLDENGEVIDVLPGAYSVLRDLTPYNRRGVKQAAEEDALSGEGLPTLDTRAPWQERVYNRRYEKMLREAQRQQQKRDLFNAAVEELRSGKPTGAFKAHVRQGIESAAPFAMGVVGASAIPALSSLVPIGAAGSGVAKGLEWIGEKAMPSALLKGAAYYLPDVAGEVATVAPYADAAALTYWGYQAAEAAREAGREGKNAEAASYGALSALPLVPAAVGAVGRAKNLLNSVKRLPDVDKSLELQYKLASGVSPEELLNSDLISSYADVPFLSATNARKARAAAEAVPAPARVAGAEWSPEELARLQAMAGTQQMDLSAYTPEQIAQAQAQMQADAPIIHDALAGNRATGAAERFISNGPVAGTKMASGYQIERYPGYMLKSLMEGNPLEKQISKSGEINVGNLRNYMKSKDIKAVDKAVMEKVLASDEFAGKKSIDYNKFRKAVQDELITYDRTPDTRWADYGVSRLGLYIDDSELNARSAFLQDHPELHWQYYVTNDGYRFGVPGERYIADSEVEAMYPGWRKKYEKKKISPETFTLSSPRIPNGNAKHYDQNTLGHSRTYTTTDEPDVLHVMESQSDWAQSGKATSRSEIENQIASLKQSLAMQEENLKNNGRYFAPKVRNDVERNIDYLKEQIEEYNARLKDAAQSGYLRDNYTSRQIQENLRYAAEKGQTKMRYPTRETAAKIEGYTKNRTRALQEDPELQKEYDDIGKALREEERRIVKKYAPDDYLDDYLREADFGDMNLSEEETNRLVDQIRRSEEFDRSPEAQKMRDEIIAARQKLNQDKWLEEHAPEMYLKEHETILKKYDAFPKQFKKLYKNADVRIVTDPKGNTWYEVDVPENYLKQEWAYADGGLLNRLSTHYGGDTAKIRELISKVRARQLA